MRVLEVLERVGGWPGKRVGNIRERQRGRERARCGRKVCIGADAAAPPKVSSADRDREEETATATELSQLQQLHNAQFSPSESRSDIE